MLALIGGLSTQATRAVRAQDARRFPTPIPASLAPQEVAIQILRQAMLQSVWGPPAHCVVRQSVHVFGKQITGVGEYIRGGQGSGKLRFNLRMPAADQLNTLLQVSDGQRVLSIESIGDVRRRTEVDLGKVRPRLVLTSDSLRDPVVAMYLAIGGQAEALRKIFQQYEWLTVRDGELGGVDVWWLKGKVRLHPGGNRSMAPIDNLLFAENRSGLLPTQIQIAVGKQNSPLPFWLYQVEQGRGLEEFSTSSRSSDQRFITEWADPQLLAAEQLMPELFDPPSSNEPLCDETEQYLPPQPSVAGTLNAVPLR